MGIINNNKSSRFAHICEELLQGSCIKITVILETRAGTNLFQQMGGDSGEIRVTKLVNQATHLQRKVKFSPLTCFTGLS